MNVEFRDGIPITMIGGGEKRFSSSINPTVVTPNFPISVLARPSPVSHKPMTSFEL